MVNVVVDCRNTLGECVLWCERSSRIMWTDILGATMHAWHPASGQRLAWPMPERLASFALTSVDGQVLLGLASRLAFFGLDTGVLTPLTEV